MKKILAFILSLVILLGTFSVVSFADDKTETYQECILSAVHNMKEEVVLSDFNAPVEEVQNFIDYVFYQYPEYYYFAGITGGRVDSQGYVKTLNFAYDRTKEQMLEERSFMESETDKVINKIGKDWSEMEKALFVHDWIDVSFMYDYDLFEQPGTENHDIVGFLKDKRGVCQSYAYTFIYIMHRLGMNAYYVMSETDNHGWNVVQIDGNWYHVDATYDDPILDSTYHYDYVGEVRHNKFLLSDSEIIADGKHDDFYIPAVDGITCGEFKGNDSWRTATTAVHKVGDYWYYLDNSKDAGGFMRTKDFKNTERLMEIGYYVEQWGFYGWMNGNKVQGTYFAGMFEYNGHLFFNDESNIYVYDSHHNVFKKLPIDKPEGKVYYGLNMNGKTITYLASADDLFENVVEGSYTLGVEIVHLSTDWEVIKEPTATEDGEKVKYCFFCAEVVETQTIPALSNVELLGDANGDGEVSTSDLAIEKLFLSGSHTVEINKFADVNKDGKVSTDDLAMLKLFLAGAIKF
ncbi:MAG: dockerin type I domain-containing protein [Acutalibacteraceae bacterium]|nr:dockerin type I domain-containing protein [Acutalibacteraceae bacterium]